MTKFSHAALYTALLLLLNFDTFAHESEPAQVQSAAIAVTITSAEVTDLEVWESSIGQLESIVAPQISSEIPGRITRIDVDIGDQVSIGQVLAEIDDVDFELAKSIAGDNVRRLQALVNAQQSKVIRNKELVKKNSANQQVLDDVYAQYQALRAELASAHVRAQLAERNLQRTRILSPIDGHVDSKCISTGDYVAIGTLLFSLKDSASFHARLPYPESLLSKMHAGLPVVLTSPTDPNNIVTTVVTEVRPSITLGSRSTQVIVLAKNPGTWQAGATVTGRVQIDTHKNTVVLPETSVVYRPVGVVVYIVNGDTVTQRIVTTGLRQNGRTEILTGLSGGESVVVDGAGFLTDGARIKVKFQ